jgi:hypothetical protein
MRKTISGLMMMNIDIRTASKLYLSLKRLESQYLVLCEIDQGFVVIAILPRADQESKNWFTERV